MLARTPALAHFLASSPARAPDLMLPFEVMVFFEFANERHRFANLPVDVNQACKSLLAIGLRIGAQTPVFANV
jgi:hypothetical protein